MINKVEKFKDRFIKAMSIRDVRAVDITAQTGIPQATISQYKTGYAQPKSDKLQKIADALDVNPAWLMGLDVPMDNNVIVVETPDPNIDIRVPIIGSVDGKKPMMVTEEEEKLVRKFRTSDKQTKEMVKRLLRYPPRPRAHAARIKTSSGEKLIVRRKNNR